jgi:hypothetical protein
MRPLNRLKIACVFLIASLCGVAPAVHARDTARAGFEIRGDAKASDLGVPIYPGAVIRKDKDDDRGGLTLAAWGGDSVFKIAVLKLTSQAPIDDIARFYRDALSRYGDVLDCSKETPASRSRDDILTCDDKETKRDSLIYKVGLPKHQHLVRLQDKGDRVHIEIVRIDAGQ